MRVTIERSAFLKALNHVQSVVERRNTIPILSNVLVRAKDAAVKLTATDLDIEIIEEAPADIAQDGAVTVPAHLLHDIVRKLPDGAQLELDQGPDRGRLSIVSGRSRFALQALPPEDFPDLAAGEPANHFNISAASLKALIEKTRFAISTEETRYYLNGIYLHEATETLRAVATDGHRLARAQAPLPDGAKGMPGVIVPRKTVLELAKLIEDQEGDIAVALSAAKVRFSFEGLVLTSKLIDGTFPDYERVIPRHNDKTLDLDTKLFAGAVDRVSTISFEKGRAVKLNISRDRLVLSVNNPDSGSAEEEIAVSYNAEPLDIGFNSRYLLDVAAQIKGDAARFKFADAGSPTIISDPADEDALYVLMPMRV
jgi:DNA polymerase III subunit beta